MSRVGWFARSRHSTLASALFAIYHVALRELTGDDDLAVATFLANRTRPEVRDTVGLLANMAVMRTRIGSTDDVAEVLRRTRASAMDGFIALLGLAAYSIQTLLRRGAAPWAPVLWLVALACAIGGVVGVAPPILTTAAGVAFGAGFVAAGVETPRQDRPTKLRGAWRTLQGLTEFAVVHSYLATATKWVKTNTTPSPSSSPPDPGYHQRLRPAE